MGHGGHRDGLIRRFRAGDEEAFRELFDRHLDALRGRVARDLPVNLRRRVSVSDVLQETRIVAYGRREDFDDRGEGAFRRWLLGIVDNKLKEAIRRHGARRRAVVREVSRPHRPPTEQVMGGGASPSGIAAFGERVERARAAMAKLPDHYAEVLRLALQEGLALGEVADRIGCSREAAKKLYGRAVRRMRELYGPEDPSHG